MLNTLLESRATRTRRTSGSLVSIGVHSAIIGALILATANATVATREEPREVAVQMTELPKPIVTPPTPTTPSPVYAAASPALGAPALTMTLEIPSVIPPIDLSRPVTNADDFSTGRRGVSSAEGGVPGGTGTVPAAGYFFEGQVEKPAMSLPGQSGPAYPDALRSAGMEGQVLAQFVVDSSGRAQLASFTALQSDHPLFTASVKATLARLRFLPAEVGNRRVPQLVQQTFQFTLNRE